MKKFVSLLLALVLLSSFPLCAFADELVLIDDTEAPVPEYSSLDDFPFSGVSECSVPEYGVVEDLHVPDGALELITETEPADSVVIWSLDEIAEVVPLQSPNNDRVVDRADIFSDAQEDRMRRDIAAIGAETGKDIVILTDVSSYGMEQRVFAADFYDYNDYGYGGKADGIILFICMDPTERGWQAVTTGDVQNIYTPSNASELDELIYGYLASARYGEGVIDWIAHVGEMYRTGHPMKRETVKRNLLVSLIVGLLVGTVSYVIARSKMKVVKTAVTARNELIEGSFKVNSRDSLDNITTTKIYDPPHQDNGGKGGSSGGHSFGGSLSGHSGTSHTSSGGRF